MDVHYLNQTLKIIYQRRESKVSEGNFLTFKQMLNAIVKSNKHLLLLKKVEVS